eukprot:TRINITY_DN2728_c0_g1_i1.p1 TRINITY_DN2728_c0_g1~~TRINITY_DN2728_c0_g1_i1.p1  ORF type:complete len:1646 (-),score=350.54 TRINITY_DN2728_c0_g1_i1:1978-6915(-)
MASRALCVCWSILRILYAGNKAWRLFYLAWRGHTGKIQSAEIHYQSKECPCVFIRGALSGISRGGTVWVICRNSHPKTAHTGYKTRPVSKMIDISMALSPAFPAFPGDPEVTFETYLDVAQGDPYRATRLSMLNHSGTHIDAPAHFMPDGARVDDIPLETLVGPAYVAQTEACRIGPDNLEACAGGITQQRLLLKTPNSARPELYAKPFQQDFCSLTPAGARWIVDNGFLLVGIDSASAELIDDAEHEAHRLLLEAGVVILEWIVLSHVNPGAYELTCLPLKLAGLDGSPARAILRTLSQLLHDFTNNLPHPLPSRADLRHYREMSQKSMTSRTGRSVHPLRIAFAATCMAATIAVWCFVLLGFGVAVLLLNPADTVPYAVEMASPGSRVEVERFEVVSTWPLAVKIQNLQVIGEDGGELFAVNNATVVTDPEAGWGSGLWIRSLELQGPRITVQAQSGGSENDETTAAVWDPEALRGLFFYRAIRCEDGSFTLNTGNRTVEVRNLHFSLEPAASDLNAASADPTLRSAALNATVRALENGTTIAEALIHGQGEVRADRFAMSANVDNARVNLADATGDVGASAEFILTPETLELQQLIVDITPTDKLREQTGIQDTVRCAIAGALHLADGEYELSSLEAELPGVLAIQGQISGALDDLPDTGIITAKTQSLDTILKYARMYAPSLEKVQGDGGPAEIALRLDQEHGGAELHATNATLVFADKDIAVTGHSVDVDIATPSRSSLNALLRGEDVLGSEIEIAGTLAAVVDADALGWSVKQAEIEVPVSGTVAAPATTNATLRLDAEALSKGNRKVAAGPVVLTGDAALTDQLLDVSRVKLDAAGMGVVKGQGAWSFDPEGRTTAAFSGQGLQLLGVSTILDTVAAVGVSEWSPSGALDVDVDIGKEGPDVTYQVQASGRAMAFASADGNYLGEKGAWSLDASGDMAEGVSFDADIKLDAGQLLLSRFFIDAGANPVRMRTSGRLVGGAVKGLDLQTTIHDIGRVSYNGNLNMKAQGGVAYNGHLIVASDSLGNLYAKGVDEPFSSDLPVLSDYTVGGSMNLDTQVRGAGADAQAAGMLTLANASFHSSGTKLEAQNVDLKLPVAYGREPLPDASRGSVRIGSAQSPLGAVKNLMLNLAYTDGALRVDKDVTLPVLGGALHLTDIAVETPYSPDFAVICKAELKGVQFENLDLGGMKVQGDIAGNLGQLRLTRKQLEIPGALGGTIFGGTLAVHDMGVVKPLTKGRRIHATIGMERVHLAPLSQATGIGKITGRLDVVVDNLVIAYGQPAAFTLTAKSVETDGVDQSISLKAVNSITVLGTGSSIGDAGVGVFGSFFKEFSYGEMGVQLSLRNDIFKVRGLIEEGGVEYLIKKPPLFGINVINRTPGKRVSFSDMLERLSRITAEGAGPKTQTEFGTSGGSGETQGEQSMRMFRNTILFTTLLAVAACVTVNIYFPTQKVDKTAEQIVDQVYGIEAPEGENGGTQQEQEDSSSILDTFRSVAELFGPAVAHAQDATSVSNPAIRDLKNQIATHHNQLKSYYQQGAVKIGKDGMLTIANTSGLSVQQQAELKRLVRADNQARSSLYNEVAKALDISQGEVGKIQNIFAKHWRDKAPAAWVEQQSIDYMSGIFCGPVQKIRPGSVWRWV